MANQYQSIDPTLVAINAAKKVTPQAKKTPVPSLTTQAPIQPSLNLQTQQPQAISTNITPPPANIGGISSSFGAPNINSAPMLGGATPNQIQERATQLQSLPKQIPASGAAKKIDVNVIGSLGANVMAGEDLPTIRSKYPEFSNIDDEVLGSVLATMYDGVGPEEILQKFPELQGGSQPNMLQNIVGTMVQPLKTMGEGLAGLTTKAGEYLDPDTYNPAIQAANAATMGAGLVDGSIQPRSEAENRYMNKSLSQNILDTAEGTAYTAGSLYAPITSAVFTVGGQVPYLKDALGVVGKGFSRVGEQLKYIPGYNQYRESLPPEDQARLDGLAGNMIAAFVGSKGKGKLTKRDLQGYLADNFSDFASLDKAFGQSIVKGTKATIAGTKALYNKIPNPIESIARKITGTADDQGKLFKAQEPRTNQLNRSVDYKNLRANSDIANEEIVKAGYKPTDTASRAEAHANTMKRLWSEVESMAGKKITVDLNPLADAIDDFVIRQRKSGIVKIEPQLKELEAQAQAFRKKGIVDGANGEITKEMLNSQIKNRGDSSIGDVYKNGLKEANRVLGQALDDAFANIPGEFSDLKRRFGALKATYEDVVKSDIKAQKAKGLGIGETFGRIEGIGDIMGAIGGLVTGKNPIPGLMSGFGKFAVGEVLAKIKDKDFLIQEGFEGLSKKTPAPKTPPITVEKGAIGMGTPKPKVTPVIPPKATVAPSVGAPKKGMPKLGKEIMEQLPNNPKKMLSLNDGLGSVKKGDLGVGIKDNDNVKKLEKSILETKEVLPIEVDKEGFIVDGEHRYKAMLNLGVKDIPVFVGKQLGVSGRLEKPYQGLRVKVSLPPLPAKGLPKLGKEIMEQDITKSDDLISEAKKYKTADEFVNKQDIVYHGTNNEFDNFQLSTNKTKNASSVNSKAVFFADDKNSVKYYGKNIKGAMIDKSNLFDYKNPDHIKELERYLEKYSVQDVQPGALFGKDSLMSFLKKGDYGLIESKLIQSYIKKKGFDGFIANDYGSKDVYGILNLDKIKTESQLKQIREQANKKPLPPLPNKGK